MKYLPLLELTIKHNYYTAGVSTDFSVIPDVNTQQMLRNYKCICKKSTTGFIVYQSVETHPVNETGEAEAALQETPFIMLDPSHRFIFDMKLINTDHHLFTDFSAHSAQKHSDIIYLTDGSGLNQQTLTMTSIDSTVQGKHFAQIHIGLEGIKPRDIGHQQYFLEFSAKSLPWQYFLIENESNDNNSVFSITHETSNEANGIHFESVTPLESKLFHHLQSSYPNSTIHCFQSTRAVACQQSSHKGIQLMREGENFIENLANPTLSNINRINEKEEGGVATRDYFYHVVTHIT